MHDSPVPFGQALQEGSSQGVPSSEPSCRTGRAQLGVTLAPPATVPWHTFGDIPACFLSHKLAVILLVCVQDMSC